MEQGAGGPRLIAIGASAGGVEALRSLAAALPADLPVALAIVLHLPTSGRSVLPGILDRAGPLPCSAARDGETLAPGRIFVAPPDHHLLVTDGVLRLDRSPPEHGNRPAIDLLFASVAKAYGPRAIGVILTGTLHDGTAGLASIKAAGGVAIVQDPAEAMYPGMPASAIERVAVDHVVRLDALAGLLAQLAGAAAPSPVMIEKA